MLLNIINTVTLPRLPPALLPFQKQSPVHLSMQSRAVHFDCAAQFVLPSAVHFDCAVQFVLPSAVHFDCAVQFVLPSAVHFDCALQFVP